MSTTQAITDCSQGVASLLIERRDTVTTVESCTGGLVGVALTSLPGSSAYYPGGYITYSNELKHRLVGVDQSTLDEHGAVSSQVAIEMARGGQAIAKTSYSIAITGIAGPDGGTVEKPVGTVWICVADNERYDCRRFVFPGDRACIRESSCCAALSLLAQLISRERAILEHEAERFEA